VAGVLPRVRRERGGRAEKFRNSALSTPKVDKFGFLGDPRVNVGELNVDLDWKRPLRETVVK